ARGVGGRGCRWPVRRHDGPGMIGMPGRRAKDLRRTLRRLLGYVRPYWPHLTAVLVLAALSTLFAIVSPKVLGDATTLLFQGFMAKRAGVPGAAIDFGRVRDILVLLAGLYVLSAACAFGQQYIMAGVAQRIVYQLRQDADAKLMRLPLRYYDSRPHGETLSRVTNDIDNISNTLQQSLAQALMAVVTVIGIIVMMVRISWVLALLTMVTLPMAGMITAAIARDLVVRCRRDALQPTRAGQEGHGVTAVRRSGAAAAPRRPAAPPPPRPAAPTPACTGVGASGSAPWRAR